MLPWRHTHRGLRGAPAMLSTAAGGRKETQAVIFDMGGVILPSPLALFKSFEQTSGLPEGTILQTILSNKVSGAWTRLEEGKLTMTEFATQFGKECSDILGRPVDMAGLMPSFNKYNGVAYPQMIDAVQCVRAEGLKTALLTNNWFNINNEDSYIPVDLAMFDVVVESCKVGYRKPHPKIYEIVLDKLGVAPERCIFLDDMGGNLKAAAQFGIRTIKVTDPDQGVRDLEKELGLTLRGYMPGTSSVPPRLRLDEKKLKSFLNWQLKLHSKDKNMVLRKKPAVKPHGVPVPKMLALCEDDSLLGTPFYIMEHVPGRIFKDHLLEDCTPEERRAIYSEMVNTLCKIHSVNIDAAGIQDYGKQASKTGEIESMDKLIEWIPQNLPANEKCTIVHGDFRLDNMVFSGQSADVVAVLDWELSTIGDPLTDLATMAICHNIPHGHPNIASFINEDLKSLGIPEEHELIQMYCQRMGIPMIEPHVWNFYVAFNFFRFAAILQGVYKRAITGQAAAPDAEIVGLYAKEVANKAWEVASRSNQKSTNQGSPLSNTSSGSGRRSYSTSTTSSMANTGVMVVTVEGLGERARSLHKQVKEFIETHVAPVEQQYVAHTHSQDRWKIFEPMEQLKEKAKAAGLWNLFLPRESDPGGKYGAGLSNVFNCSAPDTGNMEVLVKYGTEEQKQKWLTPLLKGEIRSCFGMTEPAMQQTYSHQSLERGTATLSMGTSGGLQTMNRVAFGKPLAAQGTIQADVAQSRIDIDQTRLMVAANEIAMIKVAAPNMALRVIDRAIQSHGGAGLNYDCPLPYFFAAARTLRLADGPDEVHRRTVAAREYRKHAKL
ncbi:ACD10-like protein [Mya arenaria]|uniref:ACD10-like protein n=1 Tax=Mya arenaria TaxID=6604 RepID=A0ABY7EKJ0_MYAAR|nr:ACD10-like protein [Mya arenaria]